MDKTVKPSLFNLHNGGENRLSRVGKTTRGGKKKIDRLTGKGQRVIKPIENSFLKLFLKRIETPRINTLLL